MKFITPVKTFRTALELVCRISEVKPLQPILANVFVQLRKGVVTLRVTTGHSDLLTQFAVEPGPPDGVALIPVDTLLPTLKMLDAGDLIEVTCDQFDYTTCITNLSGTVGSYKMTGDNPADFPRYTVDADAVAIPLPLNALIESIGKVAPYTGTDQLKPVFTGIFIALTDSGLTMAATDGSRLAEYTLDCVTSEQAVRVILPRKSAAILESLAGEDLITLFIDKHRLRFLTGQTEFSTYLIEGTFPDYGPMLDKTGPNEARLDAAALIGPIKRALLFGRQKDAAVRFDFNPRQVQNLQVSGENEDANQACSEDLCVEYTGEPLSIGFTGRLVCEVLDGFKNPDGVKLALTAPGQAVHLEPGKPIPGVCHRVLLMPRLLAAA